MKAQKPRFSRALLDVILSVMAMIVLLVGSKDSEGDLIPRVDYVLEVSWGDNIAVDIDTWVYRPDDKTMYYGNKDTGAVSIDRDDLGVRNDPAPPNIEVTSFRNPPDGYYYVSIHNYHGTPEGDVWIVFKQVKGAKRVVFKTSVPMPLDRKETPVFMFELKDGKVVQVRKSERHITRFAGHP